MSDNPIRDRSLEMQAIIAEMRERVRSDGPMLGGERNDIDVWADRLEVISRAGGVERTPELNKADLEWLTEELKALPVYTAMRDGEYRHGPGFRREEVKGVLDKLRERIAARGAVETPHPFVNRGASFDHCSDCGVHRNEHAAVEPPAQEPDPEFEKLWPEALLRHVVKAPSQYDSSCRAMAAEILRLRSARPSPPPARIEFDNHHNALLCPYCNPNGLKFTPHGADLEELK